MDKPDASAVHEVDGSQGRARSRGLQGWLLWTIPGAVVGIILGVIGGLSSSQKNQFSPSETVKNVATAVGLFGLLGALLGPLMRSTVLSLRDLVTGGITPAHLAATAGDISKFKKLLSNGIDINVKAFNGATPLHFAAEFGRRDVVQFLLDSGANVNAQGKNRITPVGLAAAHGHAEIISMLISRGAEVSGLASNGQGILHEPAAKGYTSIVATLLDHGVDVDQRDGVDGGTSLMFAVAPPPHLRQHDELTTDIVELLLERGADVNARDKQGRSPLQHASGSGHIGIVELLIRKGAVVNAKADNGSSSLQNAAEHNRASVAELLLVHGADVNICGVAGLTPLHYAALRGHFDVAQVLVTNGADVNMKDTSPQSGSTPLFFAIDCDTTGGGDGLARAKRMIQLLLKNGADPKVANNLGNTPAGYCVQNRHWELAKLLQAREA